MAKHGLGQRWCVCLICEKMGLHAGLGGLGAGRKDRVGAIFGENENFSPPPVQNPRPRSLSSMKPNENMNASATSACLPVATPASSTSSFVRHVTTVVRILFGLMFTVFGLNGFLNFIPAPAAPPPEGAMTFAIALMKTGYLMPLIKGTEVLAGVLLLLNRFVPLALVLLAPVVVNIVAFHVFLTPGQWTMAIVILALELSLAWAYRSAYRPLLTARATAG